MTKTIGVSLILEMLCDLSHLLHVLKDFDVPLVLLKLEQHFSKLNGL